MTPGIDDCFPGVPNPAEAAKREFFRNITALGIPSVFTEHHACHAASAFYCTDWEEAAGLVIDGHGSRHETQTIYHCRGNDLNKIAISRRPGIGGMCGAVTERLLGFDHLQDGKTMGLADWAKDGSAWSESFQGLVDGSNPSEIASSQFAVEIRRGN